MGIISEPNIQVIEVLNNDSLKSLDDCRIDDKLRVVILEFSEKFWADELSDLNDKYIEEIKHFPMPIISKVSADIKGILLDIILATHLCFVAEEVSFEVANMNELKKQIGSSNADKLNSLKGEFDTKVAFDIGIVNGVETVDNLDEKVLSVAKKIAQLAPIAIKSCLEAVNKGSEMNLKEGLKLEIKLFSQIFSTEDMKEGTSAFLEKRKPIFNGE